MVSCVLPRAGWGVVVRRVYRRDRESDPRSE